MRLVLFPLLLVVTLVMLAMAAFSALIAVIVAFMLLRLFRPTSELRRARHPVVDCCGVVDEFGSTLDGCLISGVVVSSRLFRFDL